MAWAEFWQCVRFSAPWRCNRKNPVKALSLLHHQTKIPWFVRSFDEAPFPSAAIMSIYLMGLYLCSSYLWSRSVCSMPAKLSPRVVASVQSPAFGADRTCYYKVVVEKRLWRRAVWMPGSPCQSHSGYKRCLLRYSSLLFETKCPDHSNSHPVPLEPGVAWFYNVGQGHGVVLFASRQPRHNWSSFPAAQILDAVFIWKYLRIYQEKNYAEFENGFVPWIRWLLAREENFSHKSWYDPVNNGRTGFLSFYYGSILAVNYSACMAPIVVPFIGTDPVVAERVSGEGGQANAACSGGSHTCVHNVKPGLHLMFSITGTPAR